MSSGLWVALVTATTAVLVVVLVVVLVSAARTRRRLERALASSREEVAEVHRRLDRLAGQVESVPEVRRPTADQTEYVITTAGEPEQTVEPGSAPPPVSGREFASLALGESLVRIVSLGYGVRRALSAENRNRIAFEVKREVRRSRKERRREERAARRHLRSTRQTEVGRIAEDAA